MGCDYAAIRAENERRYGTDIGRIGPMLLADRYDDRTHFIFELLQNAEDALARRPDWRGSHAVSFELAEDALRVRHYGKPFDADDVRGICGIARTTKDLTAIGRFGIGFKSVYTFTKRPEIHSGDEDFAIEDFVLPTAASVVDRSHDETLIVLPLADPKGENRDAIAAGLQRLGAGTLLFLRHIDKITWTLPDGSSGLYLRSSREHEGDGVRRITVIGQQEGGPEVEETWLVFSRPVQADGQTVGHVELAFSVGCSGAEDGDTIQRVRESPLVVFFPTVRETHLGFRVQGPYRTTPSRDNVPPSDPWNQRLVRETAALLVETLRWLRDHELLTTEVLRCLPLDRQRFAEGTMFAPLFDAAKRALTSEPLLPRFGGGYVAASKARLARTKDLRTLFDASQLARLLGDDEEIAWLSGDISQDRTPELRQYLMHECGIAEITPETILPRLSKAFLEAQSDEWMVALYEFLNGQQALWWRVKELPLVRLENGTHVVARVRDQPQAFLPGKLETGFPTVRRSVCVSEAAREFLRSLGLAEPDPVDDVVLNVLPKYRAGEVGIGAADYEADIRRIVAAFATDSKAQREKLLESLRETAFVMAVDAGDGSKRWAEPQEVYLATERLKELFSGCAGVLFVDDSLDCLRGEEVRELLEACGATRYLQRVPVPTTFTPEERRKMRLAAGCGDWTREEPIEDYTLRGLDQVLRVLPTFDAEGRMKRARVLWEALGEAVEHWGMGICSGTYHWTYYHPRSAVFDAAFVRQLNEVAWVPDASGELQPPRAVLFDTLGWTPNPFLLSKIHFKPPIIETLAKEAGIEPSVLDLLKKLGVTTEAELRSRLGIIEDEGEPAESGTGPDAVADVVKKLLGDTPTSTPPVPSQTRLEVIGAGDDRAGGGTGRGTRAGDAGGEFGSTSPGAHGPAAGSAGGRLFVSYIGVHPNEEDVDPDGLDQTARTALEEKAISRTLEDEPQLKRTLTNNPGFDLFEPGADGEPVRWVEVKAMTGGLADRPVGLSRAQFDCAQQRGNAYWLYVVEHAADAESARIVRIQDPVGRARTFTFDHGWIRVAEVGATDSSHQRKLQRSKDDGKDRNHEDRAGLARQVP